MPKVCPFRAHSSGLWRTSAVQAVATSSFQIQLGRGLLARSCLHLWAPVDLSRARFQAIVLDARTGKPVPDAAVEPPTLKDAVVTI